MSYSSLVVTQALELLVYFISLSPKSFSRPCYVLSEVTAANTLRSTILNIRQETEFASQHVVDCLLYTPPFQNIVVISDIAA